MNLKFWVKTGPGRGQPSLCPSVPPWVQRGPSGEKQTRTEDITHRTRWSIWRGRVAGTALIKYPLLVSLQDGGGDGSIFKQVNVKNRVASSLALAAVRGRLRAACGRCWETER